MQAVAAADTEQRVDGRRFYRRGAGLALLSALLLLWINGAVGIIGSEDDPANRLYFGVLAIGAAGAALARFRPAGMGRAMLATAVAQAAVTAAAVLAGWGRPWSGPLELILLNGMFIALFLGAARWFARAADGKAE